MMQCKDALILEDVLKEEDDHLGATEAGKKAAIGDGYASKGRIGLALSGGGIRSATFSLGVLQALAAEKKLASFDYLSTVSGGGYIGSWLSAWIHRAGLSTVQERLGQFGSSEKRCSPTASEPAEVTWLRRYSNYLTPRVGMLSLDSLTLITTWLRNCILNLIILVSFLACIFTAPHLLVDVFERASKNYVPIGVGAAWMGLLFCFGIGYNLWHQGLPIQRRRNWLISTRGVVATVLIPAVVTSCFGAVWLFNGPKSSESAIVVGSIVAALFSALLIVWTIAEGTKRKFSIVMKELPIYILAKIAAILVCISLLITFYWCWSHFVPQDNETARAICLISFGPPAFLLAFGLGTTVFTGLVGRLFFERSREWWSRLNAWLLALGVSWILVGLLTFFSLPLMEWLAFKLGGWLSLLGTGWIGSLFMSLFFRKPDSGSKSLQLHVDRALNVAASVFVAGLLFVVAATTQWALLAAGSALVSSHQSVATKASTTFEIHDRDNKLTYKVESPEKREASIGDTTYAYIKGVELLRSKADIVNGVSLPATTGLMLLGITLLFGWRVDINKFSLHNMYKNRLVRCYLGASNQFTRNEQPFTGLDDADDIPLRDLTTVRGDTNNQPQRPLHIINAALNITQGTNLAWQERKAASFIFTPLHCGYSLARTQGDSTSIEAKAGWTQPGYRPTSDYASRDREENGFKLGMALATSGAAVSPNMGHASSPARAFVLTMFNVRLGRWSSNPAGTAWRRPSPRFGLLPLLQELLGYSNESRDYVYLSDGGHFDNLGVYELVRRRCSMILAVDAGADPTRAFGDLADTIRKCRIDLGVDISFPELKQVAGDRKMRASHGFTTGTIRYDPNDRSKDGTLLLLKPTMARAQQEPLDVLNYAAENPPFPQQSTADQFFDESQFESYRKLGAFIAHSCLEEHGNLLPDHPVAAVQIEDQKIDEAPTLMTRLVGAVIRKFKPLADLPKRDGSLVDIFAVLVVASVVFVLAFVLADPILVGTSGNICFRTSTCLEQIELLHDVNKSAASWHGGLLWRTMLDNVFILIYTLMFLFGFIIGTQHTAKGMLPNWLRALIWLFPVVTACVDYAENFAVLGALISGTTMDSAAALTAWKFRLFTMCLIVLLLLMPTIIGRFKERWQPK